MICNVTRLATSPTIDANWDNAPWKNIPSQKLQNHMGTKPDHFPKVEVKIAYDPTALHLIFRVEDQYVRAVAAEHQASVCSDSCVEFFFTAGTDISKGYFNLEMNCGGTMLFHFQKIPRQNTGQITKEECNTIPCAHSLPRIVEPEIQEPTTWTVAYAIPFEMLKKYDQVVTPEPGTTWRANFYKCGDKTSHPHWLTWAPVDHPQPNFHLPQFFGTLEFK